MVARPGALRWLEPHGRRILLPLESLPSAASRNQGAHTLLVKLPMIPPELSNPLKSPVVARARRRLPSPSLLPSSLQWAPLSSDLQLAKDSGPYSFQAFTPCDREEGKAGWKWV